MLRGGDGAGFDSAPIAGPTSKETGRRVDDGYVKAAQDSGSDAMKGSGSILKSGEGRQSLEALVVADVLWGGRYGRVSA